MARSTQVIARRGEESCRHCGDRPEVTVTGPTPAGELTIRTCAIHAGRYLRDDRLTVTPDPDRRLAVCACRRLIGHNGRAAHRCPAVA